MKKTTQGGGCADQQVRKGINIITAAVLRAGIKLGAKQRGDRLLPECIRLLAKHLKLKSRGTIYNWMSLGTVGKRFVDLKRARVLANLADMDVELLTGQSDKAEKGGEDGVAENGDNGQDPSDT